MKNLWFVILILPTLSFTNFEQFLGISEITNAIAKGNVEVLGNYLDSNVELAVLDEEDIYNKSEAIGKLKQFFASNQPKSFSQVHQGTSKGKDSQYCIGNMVATSGNFRVYVYMKMDGSHPLIQELRFDKE